MKRRFLIERNPELRWIAGKPVSEEARRRDTRDGERQAIYHDGRAGHRWVGAVLLPPGAVAHDYYRSRARRVVSRGKQSARKRAKPKHREIVAGYELSDEGGGGGSCPGS